MNIFINNFLGVLKTTLWTLLPLMLVFIDASWSRATTFTNSMKTIKKAESIVNESLNLASITLQKANVNEESDEISTDTDIKFGKDDGEVLGTAAPYKIDDRTPLIGCSLSEFTCANGKCVPSSRYCDRINHCGDNSDEPRFCTRKL